MTWFLRRGWLLPLLLSLFVDNVRGTPVRAAALIAAVLWSAAVLRRLNRRPILSFPVLLFLFWSLGGLFFSVYQAGTLAELALLFGGAVFWAGLWAHRRLFPEESVFWPRAWIGLGLAKVFSVFIASRSLTVLSDAGTANTALTGMFLALALVVSRAEKSAAGRAAWSLLLAATLWICVRWGATAALLGLAGGLGAVEAFRRGRRLHFWVVGGGVLAFTLFVLSPWSPDWLRYNPGNQARFERLASWSDSVDYALSHPVTGTGLGTFEQHYPQFKTLPGAKTANHAHNEWLQALCEGGLPAALLLVWALWGGFRLLSIRGAAFPSEAAGLAALGAWSCLYYPFRSDPLWLGGAALLVVLSSPREAPWDLRGVLSWSGAALLIVGVSLSQGVGQLCERRAGLAWKAEEFEKAQALFQRASRWDPLEPRHLVNRSECLRALDRKPEAFSLLDRAARLKPRDVWVRRRLVQATFSLQGPAAARAAYEPILSLAPNVEQFRREYDELAKMAP